MAQDVVDFAAKFDRSEGYYRTWLCDLTPEVDQVLTAGRKRYQAMGPTLAYADDPDHPMAYSLFTCAALLCLYLELRDRDVDVHAFGGRMLKALTTAIAAVPEQSRPDPEDTARAFRASVASLAVAGERSRAEQKTGAFQFEVRWLDESDGHWAMEMTRCGICHLFGAHDAMDLVPYMCATDDVMSEAQDQGLRRSGTIALGSGCCDFDYQSGRPTAPVADLAPERIRLIN